MVLCSATLPRPLRAEAVVIVSEEDPVASAVAERWGTLAASGGHVDGSPLRRLNDRMLVLRRPLLHIHDEGVDGRLPVTVREGRPTLIFPSIHRSERNVPCVTVHPLGNPGARAEVGGRPRTLVPTDPRRMTNALRLLGEGAVSFNWGATYEATHHGPAVQLPAFFIEIGYGELAAPPVEAVRLLADVIPRVEPDTLDRVALGVGGGHYAPHFTDLARHRRWAFGHLLSRHALLEVDRATVVSAYRGSDGAEGVVYARAEDARHPVMVGVGPRLRDQEAPPREPTAREPPTGGVRSASGT